MKLSSWLMTNSTPASRAWVAAVAESIDSEMHAYLVNVEHVLQRERELQAETVLAFDPNRFSAADVLHLDCNVLRTWPDRFLDALIPFFDYKAVLYKGFSMSDYRVFIYERAASDKLKRRLYEQASIKLKRERDRRKRVYNIS